MIRQKTLKDSITFQGISLHSGANVTLELFPAEVDYGIRFFRKDLKGYQEIEARYHLVDNTLLCTQLSNGYCSLSTVEHVMSALYGSNIDNVMIYIDGPEVPIMDGSAAVFFDKIQSIGLVEQEEPRVFCKILRDVVVEDQDRVVSLRPAEQPYFSMQIDFNHPAVQGSDTDISYIHGVDDYAQIGRARTFGFEKDIEYLRSKGLIKGGSLDNAIVLDSEGIVNPEGLRFSNELVCHKLLDAIGDLYLWGMPILGHFSGLRSGHEMNNRLLHQLSQDRGMWKKVLFIDDHWIDQ